MALGGKFICEQANQEIFWLFALGKLDIFKKALMQTAWGRRGLHLIREIDFLLQKLKDLIIDFFKR